MTNHSKRETLRILSAGVVAASVPFASIAQSQTKLSNDLLEADNDLVLRFGSASKNGAQSVSLHNTGDEDVALKHVYPGLIGVGEHIFDMNHAFAAGSVKVPAGGVLHFDLTAITRGACECQMPTQLTVGKPLHVIAAEGFSSRVVQSFIA